MKVSRRWKNKIKHLKQVPHIGLKDNLRAGGFTGITGGSVLRGTAGLHSSAGSGTAGGTVRRNAATSYSFYQNQARDASFLCGYNF